jgi:hypothetical protein
MATLSGKGVHGNRGRHGVQSRALIVKTSATVAAMVTDGPCRCERYVIAAQSDGTSTGRRFIRVSRKELGRYLRGRTAAYERTGLSRRKAVRQVAAESGLGNLFVRRMVDPLGDR